jgi:hypothetical protein
LRDFHRQAGFEDEAQWLDKRLRHLVPPRQLGFLTTPRRSKWAAGRAGLQPRRNRGSRPVLVPCPAQSRRRGARDTGIIRKAL